MLFTLHMFQLGAKTSTCVTVFSLREAPVMLCIPSVSIMFEWTVRHSKTIIPCRFHSASFVLTSTSRLCDLQRGLFRHFVDTNGDGELCFAQVIRYDSAQHLKSSFTVYSLLLWLQVVAPQSSFHLFQAKRSLLHPALSADVTMVVGMVGAGAMSFDSKGVERCCF